MESLGRAAVAEFVGTFALVFIGVGAVVTASAGSLDLVGVALAHGLVLFVMVSITGHISGGLINPAVTFALWVAGKLSGQRTAVLIVVQLLAAVVGAAAVRWAVGGDAFDAAGSGAPVLASTVDVGTGTIVEAILTFLLVFAVFGTAIDERGPWQKTAGLTIGLVIAFEIMAFGPLTGAAMNPARWFGPALIGWQWANAIVWTVGPVAGGIIAAVVYTRVFLQGRAPATP